MPDWQDRKKKLNIEGLAFSNSSHNIMPVLFFNSFVESSPDSHPTYPFGLPIKLFNAS